MKVCKCLKFISLSSAHEQLRKMFGDGRGIKTEQTESCSLTTEFVDRRMCLDTLPSSVYICEMKYIVLILGHKLTEVLIRLNVNQ